VWVGGTQLEADSTVWADARPLASKVVDRAIEKRGRDFMH